MYCETYDNLCSLEYDQTDCTILLYTRVQEVQNKAEVVHLTPGLLGLGVLFNCHA